MENSTFFTMFAVDSTWTDRGIAFFIMDVLCAVVLLSLGSVLCLVPPVTLFNLNCCRGSTTEKLSQHGAGDVAGRIGPDESPEPSAKSRENECCAPEHGCCCPPGVSSQRWSKKHFPAMTCVFTPLCSRCPAVPIVGLFAWRICVALFLFVYETVISFGGPSFGTVFVAQAGTWNISPLTIYFLSTMGMNFGFLMTKWLGPTKCVQKSFLRKIVTSLLKFWDGFSGAFLPEAGMIHLGETLSYWLIYVPWRTVLGPREVTSTFSLPWNAFFEFFLYPVIIFIELFFATSHLYRPPLASCLVASAIAFIYAAVITLLVKEGSWERMPYEGLMSYDVYWWAGIIRYVVVFMMIGSFVFLLGISWLKYCVLKQCCAYESRKSKIESTEPIEVELEEQLQSQEAVEESKKVTG